jgi:hypothetical protein
LVTSVRQARAIRNVFLTIVSATAMMFTWVVVNEVDAEQQSLTPLTTFPKIKMPTCISAPMRDKVRGLTLDGLDQALKNRMDKLFDSWMKDDADQPRRAQRGLDQAIRAYVGSRYLMSAWDPPICPDMHGESQ